MADTPETPKPAKGGGAAALVGVLLPALLAGGASFLGGRIGAAKGGGGGHGDAEHAVEVAPPGPTIPLEPFVLVIPDATQRMRPIKVSIAIEFDAKAKEEAIKPFMSRIRDATLTHLRTLPFEEATDPKNSEKLRGELLERYKHEGATSATRVLITDIVSQ